MGANLARRDWRMRSSSTMELLWQRNLPMMVKVEGPGGSFWEGFMAEEIRLKMGLRRIQRRLK